MRPFILTLCVTTTAALLSSPARADNTADEADVAFVLGNEAYAKRDYQGALSEYFLSYRLVPNRNVLFNIARCYEALDRFNEAYRYFNDLASTPDLPAEDRREVQAALARIRPKVALVRVTTEPAGADVFVDREDLGSRGRAPLELAVAPGRHLIRAKTAGHYSAETTVSAQKGRTTSAEIALPMVVGKVAFAGTPEGAEIRDAPDGAVLARVPSTLSFAPGKKMFYIGLSGYQTTQFFVDVKAEETQSYPVALPEQLKATGKVIVTANRDNAIVRVDGKDSGFTPTVLLLAEGEHEVEVSMRELKTFRQRVTVVKDQEVRVAAELRYAPPPVSAASKSLLSVDEAPASTTVITSEELRAFGYTTLAEALQAVRGLYLSDDRTYTYVGIRGFSPPGDLNTRVLILWDGHAINDVWAGQGYAGRDLSADVGEVDRIEVVRGPGSALYGTGAFFAVINVVPRNSLHEKNVEATAGVASLSAYDGHVASAISSGDPGESKSALVSFAGYGAGGAESTRVGDQHVFGLDDERAYNGSARARLGGFTLHAQLNRRDKQIPNAPFGTGLGLPGTRVSDTRGFAELRYEHEFESASVAARAYYDASRYRGVWMQPPADENTPSEAQTDAGGADWVGFEGRGRFRLFGQNFLTAGLESQLQLRVDQAVFGGPDAPPLETRRRTLVSGYLLDEWRLHSRLLISAGIRVDKYLDLDATPVTPRLAVILRPYDAGITKLVAGTAFRAPNVYELYYGDNNLTQRPALALAPETIATFEVEHSHDLTEELRLTFAGYHNRITNLVSLETDTGQTLCGDPAGTETCIVFKNAPGLLRAWGGEAQLRWQPGRLSLVDVSYSYVNILPDPSSTVTVLPAHLVSARALVPLGDTGLRFAGQAVYQSARRSPLDTTGVAPGEALLVNLGISGEASTHLFFIAMVKNVLDQQWAVPAGDTFATADVAQYGRTFVLQGTLRY